MPEQSTVVSASPDPAASRPAANLTELIRQQGPLSEPEIVSVFASVLKDLEFAHSQAMLHKDITSARVIRDGAGWKLAEYGLSRVGTVRYMSPERCQGRPLDARSDVYSLGVALYEAATGRVPFPDGLNYQIIDAQVNKPPPPPRSLRPDLSPELERVILRALTKNPSGRFQNAAEFRQAIESLPLTGSVPSAVTSQPSARPRSRSGPRPKNGILVGVGAIVVLAVAGVGALRLGLLGPAAAVPSFIGLSRDAAVELAAKRHIILTFEEVDDTLPKDVVAGQSPNPGTRTGNRVRLLVSTGLVSVPVLTGFSLEEARLRLRAAGLNVARVDSQYSDVYPSGQVMAVGPKSGSRIKPASLVTLTVASGRATCPECRARREPGAQFCIRCGHKY